MRIRRSGTAATWVTIVVVLAAAAAKPPLAAMVAKPSVPAT